MADAAAAAAEAGAGDGAIGGGGGAGGGGGRAGGGSRVWHRGCTGRGGGAGVGGSAAPAAVQGRSGAIGGSFASAATAWADRRVAVGGGDGGGAVGGAGGGCEHSALVLPGHDPATDALNGRMGVESGGGDTAGDVRRANSARFARCALTSDPSLVTQGSGGSLRRLTALACTRALTDASPPAGTREGSARWTEW